MTKNVQFGVISDSMQFLIPEGAETMFLPEINSSPFDDPDGFKADLDRQNWFWTKLLGEHPSAVQYSNGRITTILSHGASGYRLSTFDKRGPLSHHAVSSLDDLLRETASWHGDIAVMY